MMSIHIYTPTTDAEEEEVDVLRSRVNLKSDVLLMITARVPTLKIIKRKM